MKIAIVVVTVIAAIIAIVVVVGWMLPVGHHASSEATFAASPDVIYAAIDKVDDYPKWRTSVKSIELVPSPTGQRGFREIGGDGPMLFVIEEAVPGKRFVTRIADKSLPFGGKWTYELTPAAAGTTLRITEDGEVYNPIFRFVSRFFMGQHGSMNAYLNALAAKLGSAVVIKES